MRRSRRTLALLATGAAVLAACASDDDSDSADGSAAAETTTDVETATDDSAPDGSAPADTTLDEEPTEPDVRPAAYVYPDPPDAPAADDQSPAAADEAIDAILTSVGEGAFDFLNVNELGTVGDPRHAWFIADLLRFYGGEPAQQLRNSFERMTGVSLGGDPDAAFSPWNSATNHLIAWDTPAYPGYQEDKAGIFLLLEEGWTPFFTDEDADIDWRYLSWGGVFIDDRELGNPNGCPGGCIPALDDPVVTDAEGGDWYPDDRIVFGLVEGDEALAIPLNIAEVHEMFNLTLGGRRIGMPYCTLCGSAQAYYTDNTGADEQPVLRTSGLLSRSNKVMYDLRTSSVFDTFTGAAVSGPLQDSGVVLEELTVVRSTWAEWKAAHPDTTIVAEDGGIGRSYELDPLGGRDDDGPIFPIGAPDDRLGVQELVVGVITSDDVKIAFPSDAASAVLAAGDAVELAGVELVEDGDGLRAVDAESGDEIAAHEAFWFAWSQFHPDTLLWEE